VPCGVQLLLTRKTTDEADTRGSRVAGQRIVARRATRNILWVCALHRRSRRTIRMIGHFRLIRVKKQSNPASKPTIGL
jgi:hypothetical protein